MAQDRAAISILGTPVASAAGGTNIAFSVRVQNSGSTTWSASAGSVPDIGDYLAVVNVITTTGSIFETTSTSRKVSGLVRPGESFEFHGVVLAPQDSGQFAVTFLMIRSGLFGFCNSILNSAGDALRTCSQFPIQVVGDNTPPRINSERGGVLYQNDFSATTLEDWYQESSGWFVRGGAYIAENTAANVPNASIYRGGYGWSNYTAAVSARLDGFQRPSSAELRVRYNHPEDFLSCSILVASPSQFRIQDAKSGTLRAIDLNITAGSVYRIQATVVDDKIACQLVGVSGSTLVARINRNSSGTVALKNAHIPVHFDDLTVSSENVSAPVVSALPAQLQFDGPMPTAQTLTLASNESGIPFTAQARADRNWLSVDLTRGTAPATAIVRANPEGLPPGEYRGQLVFQIPTAREPELSIPVLMRLSRTETLPGASASPARISTALAPGGREVRLVELPGAADAGSPSASTNSGNWLQANARPQQRGLAPAIEVVIDTTGLQAGTYSGTITAGGGQIPVHVGVSDGNGEILLARTGVHFRAAAGGAVPLPQPLNLLHSSTAPLSWRAVVEPEAPWLRLSTSTGTLPPGLAQTATITMQVDSRNMAPGDYFATIAIADTQARLARKSIVVQLTVLPAGNNPGPEILPSGVVLISGPNATAGAPLDVQVFSSQNTEWNSSRVTLDGVPWLTHEPARGRLAAGTPLTISLQSIDSAPPANPIRRGTVTILFADGTVRNIEVLNVVPPSGSDKASERSAGICGEDLILQPGMTSAGFRLQARSPAHVTVHVRDRCGNPVTEGVVTSGIARWGEPQRLTHIGNGLWSGVVVPDPNAQGPIEVSFTAVGAGVSPSIGNFRVPGQVQDSGSRAPMLVSGGVVNAASNEIGAPLSPGAMVTLYGRDLADGAHTVSGGPLPVTLGGTQVLLGDRPLPLLYVAPGQINAQLPLGTPVNVFSQISVQRSNSISTPQDLLIAASSAAIYLQAGSSQGVIVDGTSNSLLTAANPARRGQVVVVYCNGLGDTVPSIPAGTAAPVEGPVSRTVRPVQVEIGGRPAEVLFAGLTPGIAGLYQVNVRIPDSAPLGSTVPIVLVQGERRSSTATIPIR